MQHQASITSIIRAQQNNTNSTLKTSILSENEDEEDGELEMINENDYGDEDLEEIVTVEHVKQKLGGLLDQLGNIKKAKDDMKNILKS